MISLKKIDRATWRVMFNGRETRLTVEHDNIAREWDCLCDGNHFVVTGVKTRQMLVECLALLASALTFGQV